MIKIGITGQNGFVAKHLINEISKRDDYKLIQFRRKYFEVPELLEEFVSSCDVIFHLAAINRHDSDDYIFEKNIGFAQKLINALEVTDSKPHVIMSSSTQEQLDNPYGNSKKISRELFSKWAEEKNSKFSGLIIPNVFGPNGKPFYNSFIATFSHLLMNNEKPEIKNDSYVNLIYVKDLVAILINQIDSSTNSNLKVEAKYTYKVTEVLEIMKSIINGSTKNLNEFESKLKKTIDSFVKKKILILGSSGMAGHVIYNYLRDKNEFEIIDVSFRQKLNEKTKILDVRNFDELTSILSDSSPDYVINAIGILVGDSSKNPSNSILLNSYLPHFLAELSNRLKYKLIHLSTDCVFSGKHGNYLETSLRDADDIYGRSKALGEVIDNSNITIRTSIVGPEIKENGTGLLHWFLRQEGTITGYTNAYWSGITTLELAKVIYLILIDDKSYAGLYHVTNNNKISKYDMLLIFKDIWNKEINIQKGSGNKDIDKSFVDSKNNFQIPSYEEMFSQLYQFMSEYDNIYNYSKRYILNYG